jgi:hypothetical protein
MVSTHVKEPSGTLLSITRAIKLGSQWALLLTMSVGTECAETIASSTRTLTHTRTMARWELRARGLSPLPLFEHLTKLGWRAQQLKINRRVCESACDVE